MVGFSIIWLISLGDFLATASRYPADYMYLALGIVLAVLVSIYTVRDLEKNSWHKSFAIYFVYYFGALSLFVDRHQVG